MVAVEEGAEAAALAVVVVVVVVEVPRDEEVGVVDEEDGAFLSEEDGAKVPLNDSGNDVLPNRMDPVQVDHPNPIAAVPKNQTLPKRSSNQPPAVNSKRDTNPESLV